MSDISLSPIIRVTGLEKAYGRTPAVLHDVSLSILSGERVALIGSNGCGKSTLLKSLIGMHPITGGTVEILGEAFGPASSTRRSGSPNAVQKARLRRQMGFVFQKHCLVRRLTVLSNVVHGLLGAPGSWRGFSHTTCPAAWRARAMEALESVNLTDKALSRADALSGGQQQRVAIARALVRDPSLLIADEPAASLDPASGADVMALFRALAEQTGISLLFTTHDMDHALDYATRIIALKAGTVFFDQPRKSVRRSDFEEVFNGAPV